MNRYPQGTVALDVEQVNLVVVPDGNTTVPATVPPPVPALARERA